MFVVAANWTWMFYLTSTFSRGLVFKRAGRALTHQRPDSFGGSWPLEFSKMCAAAEVVINWKQEQPAAKNNCAFRHLFNSPHAHIMLTWQQQEWMHAWMNEWMCFRAIKGHRKTVLSLSQSYNLFDLQVKPGRDDVACNDVTCKFLTFFPTGSWRFCCTFMVLHIYEQRKGKMCCFLYSTMIHCASWTSVSGFLLCWHDDIL